MARSAPTSLLMQKRSQNAALGENPWAKFEVDSTKVEQFLIIRASLFYSSR